ncbi:hypothetical protein AALP_AA5G021900 [Arabis alpina]|uniref:Uncharacterized protein n=1 Tax=Arabis alpina TaxID=50452 RepID=A0A087GUF6_ARAAL|nr:hypothetical protein AALP_AA5G021900 [Arabis alpina]
MATPPVNLWVVLSESRRIIKAHSRHFFALSVLFLLPSSLCTAVYPTISRLITEQSPKTVILLSVAYLVVVSVFNLLAIGSIAYSIFQRFYGRPVKLISAVKSSLSSFFPLHATLISMTSILLGIFLVLAFAAFLLKTLMEIIIPGLEISFLAFAVIVTIIAIIVMFKFQVDWILSLVIVVVESVWGLKPLKISKSLTKGMRRVSLSILLFFIVTSLPLGWISSATAPFARIETGRLWTTRNAYFMLQIVIVSAFQTFLMLYNVAATTVMYIYCKDFHGEVGKYVSLPFDDDDGKLLNLAYNNV